MAEHTKAAHAEHGDGHGHDHGDAAAHEAHYKKIYIYLVVLFLISYAGPYVGSAMGMIAITLLTAFGIAFVKAFLVVKNFMHLTIEPKYVGYISATALAFMGIFFFFVAPDVMKHTGRNWENGAAAAATHEVDRVEGEFVAADVYVETCGPCHGAAGRVNGVLSSTLNPRPMSFQSAAFWDSRDRAAIVAVITHGGEGVLRMPTGETVVPDEHSHDHEGVKLSRLMPPYGEAFTPEQIEALADVVIGFRPAPAVAVPTPTPTPTPAPTPTPTPTPEGEVVAETGPAVPEISDTELARRVDFIHGRLQL